jgi:Fic family protein
MESNKNSYYEALREARQSYEVTPWIRFFLSIILESQKRTEDQVELVLRKTRYFTRHRDHLNKRQRVAITSILDNGPDRIREGLTARSYMSLTDASKATATRDLQDLVQKEALLLIGSGRGARYAIMLD